jgi:hypothetical protein
VRACGTYHALAMTPILLVAAVLYVLHQDVWFWRTAQPLVFGFLPIGLFYHAAYTALIAVLLFWLTRAYWPDDLDDEAPRRP